MAAAEQPKPKPRLDGTIAFNELTIGKKIGFGSFANVFKATSPRFGGDVVYKKFKNVDFVDPDEDLEESR